AQPEHIPSPAPHLRSILFPYTPQHSPSQRSSIASPRTPGLSCSLTSYNTQRARDQQLPCPRTAVDPVHLPTTTLSKPEVSNCLVPEPRLILFTYLLQHSASQRSAIALSPNRG